MRVLTGVVTPVAEASADLWRAVMSAEDVHPDLDRGAAAGPGHGAAPDAGATAIAAYNRAHCDVATEYGVSWATAHKALGAAAARGCRSLRRRGGWGSTRPGLVRWILDGVTWRRFGPRSSIAAVMGRDRCWGWLLAAVPTVAFSTHAVAETDWIRRNVTDVWMFAPEPSRNDMACGSVAPPPEAGHLTRPRAC